MDYTNNAQMGGVSVSPYQQAPNMGQPTMAQAQPVYPNQQQAYAEQGCAGSCNGMQDTLNQIDQVMNGFSDREPGCQDDMAVKEAKNTLSGLLDYIKSADFKNWVNNTAAEYKVPPKKVAENFLTKILGIIGDILGIAIATVGNVAHTVVTVISHIIHGAINGVIIVANGIANTITLNQTNVLA